VLGDNRMASSDSRVWGVLPANDIVGRVWTRVFPINAATTFHTPSYQ
jgi:signal peptidase I